MTLREQLNLSYVPRWAIVPMLRQQSVAEHSWRVTVIFVELCRRLHVDGLVKDTLWDAITHDIDESFTGDTPSTRKMPSPPPRDIEDLLIKVADILETRSWIRNWGHPSRIRDVIVSNDVKFQSVVVALNKILFGAADVIKHMDEELRVL